MNEPNYTCFRGPNTSYWVLHTKHTYPITTFNRQIQIQIQILININHTNSPEAITAQWRFAGRPFSSSSHGYTNTAHFCYKNNSHKIFQSIKGPKLSPEGCRNMELGLSLSHRVAVSRDSYFLLLNNHCPPAQHWTRVRFLLCFQHLDKVTRKIIWNCEGKVVITCVSIFLISMFSQSDAYTLFKLVHWRSSLSVSNAVALSVSSWKETIGVIYKGIASSNKSKKIPGCKFLHELRFNS